MADLFLLTKGQMRRIEPSSRALTGEPRVDDRLLISGIIYVIRYGLQRKDAPSAYGYHKNSRCDLI